MWWQGTVSDYLVAVLCVIIVALLLFYGVYRVVKACRTRPGERRSRWGRVPKRDVEVATGAVGRVIGRGGERF